MISKMKQTALFLTVLGMMSTAAAQGLAPDFMDKLLSEDRPLDDRARDGARRPYQVMQLLGVEAGMTVVDVGSGGGWYARVLAAAVGEDGRVIAQGLGGRAGPVPQDLIDMDHVDIVASLDEIESNSVDVAVTGLNVHHSNRERAVPYFGQILEILKPGGVAAITDHIGDPDRDNSQLHRIAPELVRGWIEAAGFEIVEESNLLRTYADDHSLSSQDPRLGRNTDRFLFVVRKPG